MLTHTVFQRRYRMKYSEIEEVDEISEIQHPILRETLLRHWRGNPLEIASVADVPAGTGMGSSGAFTVCLLKAPGARAAHVDHAGRARRGGVRDRDRRAGGAGRQAGSVCRRARRHLRLHVPSGRQRRGRAARARPPSTLRKLRDQLLLFYTGEARSASTVLADQDERSRSGRRGDAREPAPHQGDRAPQLASCCCDGDLEAYAELMHEHWEQQARALARHGQRADRPPVHARAPQRRDRRQARGRRRRRVPARLRAATRGHAPGDGRSGGAGARVRLRVRRRVRAASTREPIAASRSSAAG